MHPHGHPAGDDPPAHGSIRLIEDKCTSCMICVRECPTWCIHIESHSEELPPTAPGHPSRGRERRHNVLDSFDIDWSLCMYCGICIEECPFDALEWAGPHVPGVDSRRALVHDRSILTSTHQLHTQPQPDPAPGQQP
ncbi:NADH-quinone oxidoreductase subunit I [Propionibacteriaceae bacterium Y1923]